METNGHYFKVGLFVLLLSLALIISIFWIGGKQWIVSTQAYDIYYEEDVSGVILGSPVFIKGIEAGSISDIRLTPYQGKTQVRIRILLDSNFEIHEGAYANLQFQGITGKSVIEINPGDPTKPLLKNMMKGIPVIPSRQSGFGELIKNVPKLVNEFITVGEHVNETFSEENQKAIREILNNSVNITNQFNVTAKDMHFLIANANQAVENFNQFLLKVEDTNSLFQVRGAQTLDGIDRLVDSATQVSNRADHLLAAVEQPVADFANYGLDELTLFITELRNLTSQLSKMLHNVERGPTAFLLGKDDDEIKLKK